MSHRRMVVVPLEELRELRRLAAAACRLHDLQSHVGQCDVCELVSGWRGRLDDEVDVVGLRSARRHRTQQTPEP